MIIDFRTLDDAIVRSNKTILLATDQVTNTLQYKLSDPSVLPHTFRWNEYHLKIREYTRGILSYIDSLKNVLKGFTSLSSDKKSFDEGAMVNEFFYERSVGKKLLEKLRIYRRNLMSVDSLIEKEFDNRVVIIGQDFDTASRNDFTEYFFKMKSIVPSLALLDQFQNNILIAENKLVTFCSENMCILTPNYSMFSPVVAQSSSIVTPGEKIEITAGLLAFNVLASTEIRVDDIKIPINESGYGFYKFKASRKIGKHYIPVQISFVDRDGTRQHHKFQVEYTVMDGKK